MDRAPDGSVLECGIGSEPAERSGALQAGASVLTAQELESLVAELADRPGHEKVRALLHRLLVDGLGLDSRQIDFEKPAPEVRGRMDALLGRTVVELKSDLRRERGEAERGLSRYLRDREDQTGERYVGIATDGAEFSAYFLRGAEVEPVGGHRTNAAAPAELVSWLRSTVAVGSGLHPDPETIRREFGRDSLAARRALSELGGLWEGVRESPEAMLKRDLWNRLLSLAYGADVGDESLFLQHTYLVIVAKAVVWAALIESKPTSGEGLLHGTGFSELGITGQSEADFFDWVLGADGGAEFVMRVVGQVSRFRLEDIRMDILKALYESLIDPETRHDLGEYYTPDWLAARMVREAVDKPLALRVMDPACGSGTFLFHAVRRLLAAAELGGLSAGAAARLAVERIAGVDIHPVAVIFARATYLLALVPALREEHPGEVTLPVYLGDALQWNRARTGEEGEQADLFAGGDTLEIYVPAVTLADPPRRFSEALLSFPSPVAADAGLLDRVLGTMIEYGSRSERARHYDAWLDRETVLTQEDRRVLRTTYRTMRELQEQGRNHIWGYVARNLARPVWLSSDEQKADVVVGNPPWVTYRRMKGEFQARFREEARAAQLWWSGRGTSANDLSAYFYARAALLYMRARGRVALVMPFAAMSRQAYRHFREGIVGRLDREEFRLRFTRAWTFDAGVQPLFPVPSCVLFAERQVGAGSARLPNGVEAFSGSLPRRDADEAEADDCLTSVIRPWPSDASVAEGSSYRKRFRQGAILVPRRLTLVERVTTGALPPNPETPLVLGQTGNQDKDPWKQVDPPRGTVEKEFLRSAILGECVLPFRVLSAREAVVPWEQETGALVDASGASARGHRHLARWMGETERLWNEHGRGRRALKDQHDYYGQLSAQFPLPSVRVVYTKAGRNLVAAVVRDGSAVVDHTLYWGGAGEEEAYYLCALLNSECVRMQVEQYQAQGQWGARHFDKYVFNLPIPVFDQEVALHGRLAAAGRVAEEVAAGVEVPPGEHFQRARRVLRASLVGHGIAGRTEELVAELLKVGAGVGKERKNAGTGS